MNANPTIEALIELGLTRLEARLYVRLLQDSPTTGYALAKATGKSAASVYKALEGLEAKGAIEVDRGETRLCRPLPATELLALLEARFERLRRQAADGLRDLPGPEHDTRIYHLGSTDQVLRGCHRMLASATHSALIDFSMEDRGEMVAALEQAAARGVEVAAKVYRPIEILGCRVLLEPDLEVTRERWPARWVHLTTDGSRVLAALLSGDGREVIQAFWSASPFVAWLHQLGLSSEMYMMASRAGQPEGDTSAPVADLEDLYRTFVVDAGPGYERLRQQLRRGETGRVGG